MNPRSIGAAHFGQFGSGFMVCSYPMKKPGRSAGLWVCGGHGWPAYPFGVVCVVMARLAVFIRVEEYDSRSRRATWLAFGRATGLALANYQASGPTHEISR